MSDKMTRRHLVRSAGAAGLAMNAAPVATRPPEASKGKRIIDVHAHLKHGDAAKTEYSAEQVLGVMDAVGIDRSVVFAMSTTTKRSIEFAEEAVKHYPDRLIPFLYALPNYERSVLEEIDETLTTRRFRGIKIHAGECTLAPYVIDPVLKLAGERGVPCLIDAKGNAGVARRLAETFPETTMLFAHMGAYLSRDRRMVDAFIQLAQDFENVFLDLSAVALVFKIEEAVRRAGAEKLIWGTDGPHKNPTLDAYAQFELDKVRRLPILEVEKDKILGANIAKLLDLQ